MADMIDTTDHGTGDASDEVLDRRPRRHAAAGWAIYSAATLVLFLAVRRPIAEPEPSMLVAYEGIGVFVERVVRGAMITWHLLVGVVLAASSVRGVRTTWGRPSTVLAAVAPVVAIATAMLSSA